MSLLIFNLTPERVSIFTDTLKTLHDGQPLGFATKVHQFPHANVVLVVLGTRALGRRWVEAVDEVIWRDADELSEISSDLLLRIATSGAELGLDAPSRAFLFGWSPLEDRFIGRKFSYRKGYLGEAIAYGAHVYPAFVDDAGRADPQLWGEYPTLRGGRMVMRTEPPETMEDFVGVANQRQMALEDLQPGPRIGGDLLMTFMEKSELGSISTYRFSPLQRRADVWQATLDAEAVRRQRASLGLPAVELAPSAPKAAASAQGHPMSRQQRRALERQQAKAKR